MDNRPIRLRYAMKSKQCQQKQTFLTDRSDSIGPAEHPSRRSEQKMDIQQFNQIYNKNDDFIPDFDLGMDQLMSSLNERETDGPETNISDPTNRPLPNNSLTDDDIHDFMVNQKAKSTTYKDASGIKRLQTFMQETNPGETRMFFELSKTELDKLMCEFFIMARKVTKPGQTDNEYEPDTLSSFRNSWQRVIADKGYSFDIRKDPEFERLRSRV